MAYTVDFTDGTKTAISVSNGGVETSTSLGLVGRGFNGYGETVAENFLHLLENFASGSAPSKPIEGQLWYDSANNSLKYFDDTVENSGNWKPVASMTVQGTAPTTVGETDGHFWLDSDTGLLYLYYNGSWLNIADASSDTRLVARTRWDNLGSSHRTLEMLVAGEIVSIVSSDDSWQPADVTVGVNGPEYLEDGSTLLSTQYPTIGKGITMTNQSNYFFAGTASRAQYADLAERYHADQVYEAGTVVKIGGVNEVTQTDQEFCTDVFGVVSAEPAFGMNAAAGTDETHPFVALSGRLPVKVIGKVSKGDRLVSSNLPGHAMSTGNTTGFDWQFVIGRALEDKDTDGPGTIEVVVGTK